MTKTPLEALATLKGHQFKPVTPEAYLNAVHTLMDFVSERQALTGAGEPVGWKLVPIEPPTELLMSMAVRQDHALGCPGYYDQGFFAPKGISHADRVQSAIRTMRQIYEEVVGQGFYSPERAGEYAAMLATSPQTPTPDPDTVTVRREDAEIIGKALVQASIVNMQEGKFSEALEMDALHDRLSQALQVMK